MNLNVFIAKSGVCSRRDATVLVKEGRVTVNGKIVREPWHDVEEGSSVKVGNKLLRAEKHVYIVFNKPKGVTATLEDRFAAAKVTDFIPKKFGRVYPVGRLDKFSRGLIILTNDGDLCYAVTHPKFEVEKEYLVIVSGEVDRHAIDRIKKGVKEGDDVLSVKSAVVEYSSPDTTKLKVVVCEGKKRHLRRLFEQLGYTVNDLKRVRVGRLTLGDLKEGEFRVLDKDRIYACFQDRKKG